MDKFIEFNLVNGNRVYINIDNIEYVLENKLIEKNTSVITKSSSFNVIGSYTDIEVAINRKL